MLPWDNWEDHQGNDQLDFLGGATWTICDARSSLSIAITSGDEDDANNSFSPRTMYSVVYPQQVTGRLSYVLQHEYGVQESGLLVAVGYLPCEHASNQ